MRWIHFGRVDVSGLEHSRDDTPRDEQDDRQNCTAGDAQHQQRRYCHAENDELHRHRFLTSDELDHDHRQQNS